jgi:hypothetical protein
MSTAAELDYAKIRDAMDLATEKLRKKEADDASKSKKEQEKSKEKIDAEKKNKIFKWTAYAAAIIIGIIIIVIIIILVMRMSSSNSSPNIIKEQPPIINKQFNYQPYELYPIQPPPQMPIQMPMQNPQMPIQMPMQNPQMPMLNNNRTTSSFNFPSNDSSFFNKLDTSSSLVKRGGYRKK